MGNIPRFCGLVKGLGLAGVDRESDDFIGAIHEFGKAVMGVGDVAGLVGAGDGANDCSTGFDSAVVGDDDDTGFVVAVGELSGPTVGVWE